jgi:hypothetical protein
VGYGLNLEISSILMIDMKHIMHTLQLQNKAMLELNTDLAKCFSCSYPSDKRYEDVGDMKRGIYYYEKGVSQGDSASLYVYHANSIINV